MGFVQIVREGWPVERLNLHFKAAVQLPPKNCQWCKNPIPYRQDEGPQAYIKRKFCSYACSNRSRRTVFDARAVRRRKSEEIRQEKRKDDDKGTHKLFTTKEQHVMRSDWGSVIHTQYVGGQQ